MMEYHIKYTLLIEYSIRYQIMVEGRVKDDDS